MQKRNKVTLFYVSGGFKDFLGRKCGRMLPTYQDCFLYFVLLLKIILNMSKIRMYRSNMLSVEGHNKACTLCPMYSLQRKHEMNHQSFPTASINSFSPPRGHQILNFEIINPLLSFASYYKMHWSILLLSSFYICIIYIRERERERERTGMSQSALTFCVQSYVFEA